MGRYMYSVSFNCKEITFGEHVKGVRGIVWYLLKHSRVFSEWDFSHIYINRLDTYEVYERKEYSRLKKKFAPTKDKPSTIGDYNGE